MTCPRCLGLGWQCEDHDEPMHHRLPSGEQCGGAGKPCEYPGCPDAGKREFDQIIASTSEEAPVGMATRLRELLKALESAFPPPVGGHHAITFNRYGSDADGWSDQLGLHIRRGSGVQTFFLDEGDLEKPPADLIAEILRASTSEDDEQ